jgi:hypothetical protein
MGFCIQLRKEPELDAKSKDDQSSKLTECHEKYKSKDL